jgi:biofilm PGA synthesis N-glycosyltransferase PgaC
MNDLLSEARSNTLWGNGSGVPPALIHPRSGSYLPVRDKLALAFLASGLWLGFSTYVALPWLSDLRNALGWLLAVFVVTGVALIPGGAMAFLLAGLLFDRRPTFRWQGPLPGVTLLIAAFNEEKCIVDTLSSIAQQAHPGPLEVIVIDDGSLDRTAACVNEYIAAHPPDTLGHTVRLLQLPRNGGKARALNDGLALARHELIVTTDADTLLWPDALRNLVANQIFSPPNTAATAGCVLVRNSRTNLMTRLQEWDYFLGIAIVKRIQSLFQGTLVAQGALSIYRRDVLRQVGGWEETVGEDIVLTWAMLKRGYRVGYAENALAFTHVPETYGEYYRQRRRWARGLVEAFERHPGVLIRPRLNTPFIYLNLLFPYLDLAYLLAFVPGVFAAIVFRNFLVVGPMTLWLVPLAVLCNSVMFLKQRAIFRQNGLKVRKNLLGVLLFTLGYQLLVAPASCMGYAAELLHRKKSW